MKTFFLQSFLLLILIYGIGNGDFMTALAQQTPGQEVGLRITENNGYERIVMEWPGPAPEYAIETTEDGILMNVEMGNVSMADFSQYQSGFIHAAEMRKDKLHLTLSGYDKIRDFAIGSKIIIDIYGPIKEATSPINATNPPPIPEDKMDLKGFPNAPPAATLSVDLPPETELQEPTSKDNNEISLLEQTLEEEMSTGAHIIRISSTEKILLSAYTRFGSLWIVTSKDQFPIPPEIKGPNRDIFGSLKKHDSQGKIGIWQLNLPPGYKVTGEGGSLFWRLILSREPPPGKGPKIIPERQNIAIESVRSAQLSLPLSLEKTKIEITDPITGESIHVILVDSSGPYNPDYYDFVDFDILPSAVGLAILPENNSLNIELKPESVEATHEQGLALTRPQDASISAKTDVQKQRPSASRLFDFQEWQMGSQDALEENHRLLMTSLGSKSDSALTERLLTLAKLNLSHGRGGEAQGLLRYAENLMPDLLQSPPFIALRGVARAITGQNDLAVRDLASDDLDEFIEAQIWKSHVLAQLGDWQQAIDTLPKDFSILNDYPPILANPLILSLAEIALKAGNKDLGKELLARIQKNKEQFTKAHKHGLSYLQGEVQRQNGKPENAIEKWQKLTEVEDPLYRTKAQLALTSLQLSNGKIKAEEAVDRLERLRFVWRGNDLEIQVLRKLGLTQIENEEYLKGFQTLRDSVVLATDNALTEATTKLMRDTYKNIFLTDQLQEVSPLDAAMLYEEFRELTPAGEEGDELVSRLADRLLDADLFKRAGTLLEYQLEYRLNGDEALNTALRLAAIQLKDDQAEAAIDTLNQAETILKNTPNLANKPLKKRDIAMLRARALSELNDVTAALNLLANIDPPGPAVSRLAADIAWRSNRWNEAANALRELLLDADIPSDQPLTTAHEELLMSYATALSLSGSKVTLLNLRERHLDQMKQTDSGQQFEVLTRPSQNIMLSDRETIMNIIGETEIFNDFLESYRE